MRIWSNDDLNEKALSRHSTRSPRVNSWTNSMVDFDELEVAISKAFKSKDSKTQKELAKVTNALINAKLLDSGDVYDEHEVQRAATEATRRSGSVANSVLDYFVRYMKEKFNLKESVQEAYERGFQNGFSMALDEKGTFSRMENSPGIISNRFNAIRAYAASLAFFIDDNNSVYLFFKELYERFGRGHGKGFAVAIRELRDGLRKIGANEYDNPMDMDKNIKFKYIALISRTIMTDFAGLGIDPDSDDSIDEKELNDSLKWASRIAKHFELNRDEIMKFYKSFN